MSNQGIIQQALEKIGAIDAPIGTSFRIRFPADRAISDEDIKAYQRAYEAFPVEQIVHQASQMLIPEEPANPLPVVGYDALRDELVYVTQAWVDQAKRIMSGLDAELAAARKQIAALTEPTTAAEPSESDRRWRTIQAAAAR